MKKLFDPSFPFKPSSLPFHYGWVIAIAAASGMIASIPGQTNGVNVFNDELIKALGLSRTQISASYLVGTATSGILLLWAGGLYDILGSRRLIVVSSVGLGLSLCYLSVVDFLPSVISSWMSWETIPPSLLLVSLTVGFFLIRFTGQGLVTMAGRNMVAKWWKYHRGKVLPYTGIAVSVCFSLAGPAFYALISWSDWRTAWQLLGAVLIFGFATYA